MKRYLVLSQYDGRVEGQFSTRQEAETFCESLPKRYPGYVQDVIAEALKLGLTADLTVPEGMVAMAGDVGIRNGFTGQKAVGGITTDGTSFYSRFEDVEGCGMVRRITAIVPALAPAPEKEAEAGTPISFPTDQYGNVLDGEELI